MPGLPGLPGPVCCQGRFAVGVREKVVGGKRALWGHAGLNSNLRVVFFVAAFMGVMLGGGVLLANNWGEAAAGLWTVVCIVMLIVLRKRIVRLFPMLYLSGLFQEVLTEKIEEFRREAEAAKSGGGKISSERKREDGRSAEESHEED